MKSLTRFALLFVDFCDFSLAAEDVSLVLT